MKVQIDLPGYYEHGYSDIEKLWINEDCVLENNVLWTEKEYMIKEPNTSKYVLKEAVPMSAYELTKLTVKPDGDITLLYQGPKQQHIFKLECIKRMLYNKDMNTL